MLDRLRRHLQTQQLGILIDNLEPALDEKGKFIALGYVELITVLAESQFSIEDWHVLLQYYDANRLLVDCLNNASNVSLEMRSHIEDTLLLPIAEIEKQGLGD